MLAFYSSLALLCLNLGPSVLGHPTKRAPGDAWDVLYNGHNAFLSEIERDHPGSLKDLATSGQHPNFTVLACSDSRVAPEMIFNTQPGTIFSERVVANQYDPLDLPEKELVDFRANHTTNATIEAPKLRDPAFRALVEENVKRNVLNIAESSFIKEHWSNTTNPPVFVYGLVYDIENGSIFDLNFTRGPSGSSPPSSPFPGVE
uniref:Carbonic anhydrase n=1 Tax=Flammulina filiformis TaxID=2060913 RepID=A0A6G6AA29_9AGAR|nr:carbonic anhydrase [Flammulina filiformis]